MRRLAKAGVLTILIAWAVTAEWSSLTCKPSHEPYGQNQSDHQKCTVPRAVFYDTAAPVLRLIRDIVHDFRDELLAIATVLIAFFTATLWRATDRLWKSAENQITEFRASVLQAKEAAASQATDMAAYIQQASRSASAAEVLANAAAASANAAELMAKVSISVELPALFVESAIIPLAYQENVEDWFYHLLPTISVRNYGRTPAIIREVNIVAHIGKLPETPYYPPAAYMRLTAITNG